MKQKKTFKTLFILLAITLVFLPFVITFNNFFAFTIENTGFYRLIRETILPRQVKMAGVVLRLFKINVQVGMDTLYLTMGVKKTALRIGWNCTGWQSFLLFLISLIVGLQGDFTFSSKLICSLIGFLGTFLLNILRMVITAVGIFYISDIFGMVLHDYFAALMTVAWLGVFWWFSYSYVLEEKR